jgi:hypothetical protein
MSLHSHDRLICILQVQKSRHVPAINHCCIKPPARANLSASQKVLRVIDEPKDLSFPNQKRNGAGNQIAKVIADVLNGARDIADKRSDHLIPREGAG